MSGPQPGRGRGARTRAHTERLRVGARSAVPAHSLFLAVQPAELTRTLRMGRKSPSRWAPERSEVCRLWVRVQEGSKDFRVH